MVGITTERLHLREMTQGDAPFLLQLLNDPGWLRFIGDREVHTVEQARRYLRRGPIASYREHGYGLYLVETREPKQPVGICGPVRRPGLDRPDLGFAFLEAHCGKGYGTESGRAVLKHAQQQLGLHSLLAITDPENVASIRVLEKMGFQQVEKRILPGEEEAVLVLEWVSPR